MPQSTATQNVIVVVGNIFETFATNVGAITVRQLSRLLSDGRASELPDNTVFLPGQGLQDADAEHLMQQMEWMKLDRRFDLRLRKDLPQRTNGAYTHKRKPENSILSVPQLVGDDVYEMDLMVDERSELMSDHQTGQHIQGMIVVEAARQAFLAVTERFFIDHKNGVRYYFIINAMNTQYINFLFPLPATIRYVIQEKKVADPTRLYFHGNVEFHQAGKHCATVEVKFTAFESDKIIKKESARAEEALHWFGEETRQRLDTGVDRIAA